MIFNENVYIFKNMTFNDKNKKYVSNADESTYNPFCRHGLTKQSCSTNLNFTTDWIPMSGSGIIPKKTYEKPKISFPLLSQDAENLIHRLDTAFFVALELQRNPPKDIHLHNFSIRGFLADGYFLDKIPNNFNRPSLFDPYTMATLEDRRFPTFVASCPFNFSTMIIFCAYKFKELQFQVRDNLVHTIVTTMRNMYSFIKKVYSIALENVCAQESKRRKTISTYSPERILLTSISRCIHLDQYLNHRFYYLFIPQPNFQL